MEWWSYYDTKQTAKRYAVIRYKWINPVRLIVGRTECSPLMSSFDSFWPKYCQARFNDIYCNVFRVTRLQESFWCRQQEGEFLVGRDPARQIFVKWVVPLPPSNDNWLGSPSRPNLALGRENWNVDHPMETSHFVWLAGLRRIGILKV